MNGSLRRGSPALAGLAATVALAASCSHPGGSATTPAQAAAAPPQGAAAFETVKAVLQSPRCVNCHPAGDAPLQGDDSHVHLQHIQRGVDGHGVAGLTCAACHGQANPPASYGPHAPPGVSTMWRLPPADTKMVFEGLGARALCEQLKDPQRNGGKDLAALIEHVSADAIVLWGWSPGYGRKAVPIAHADFVAAFKAWAQAGAPCPTQ
ncbi:MAG TPA: Isoquinoline 1-oxidoreductase subunit [Anaeromyxobacteraceae bacterium]